MMRKHNKKHTKQKVFISYRRKDGIDTARWLYDQLEARGYHVFMDLESLQSGVYDQALYQEIESSDAFLLILSKESLDRCQNDGDWIRQEIAHALRCKLNIIPIIMDGFQFPAELPEDIKAIQLYQGIPVSYNYFDAFLEKIEHFIAGSQPDTKLSWKKYLVAGLLTVAALTAGVFWLNERNLDSVLPAQPAKTSETTESAPLASTEQSELSGNSVTNLCNGGFIALTPENNAVYLTSSTLHWFNRLDTDPETKYFYDSNSKNIKTIWKDDEKTLSVELIKDVESHYLYTTSEWLYCVLKQDDGSYAMCRARNYPETHSIGPLEPIIKHVLPNNRFAIQDGYIYYWIQTEGLFRCSLDGSNPELLFNNGGSDNLFGLITFHVSEESVYFWAFTGGIYSVPVTGGPARHLLDTTKMDGVPTHAVWHNGVIYYVMEKQTNGIRTAPAELWCVNMDGSENQHIAVLEHADQEILSMNISNEIFLKVRNGEKICMYKLSLHGGQLNLLLEY